MGNSLQFTIGGDATPFVSAMKTVERVAASASNVTIGELRKASKAIEAHATAQLASGRSTRTHAEAHAFLTANLVKMEGAARAAEARVNSLAVANYKAAKAAREAATGMPATVSGWSLSDRSDNRTERKLTAQRKAQSDAVKNTNNEIELKRIQAEEREAKKADSIKAASRQRAERADRAANSGVKGFASNIFNGAVTRFLGVSAAIGAIYSTIRTGWESIQANISMQRVSNAFEVITGSAAKARDEINFLKSTAQSMGTSFQVLAEGSGSFTSAGKEAGISPAKIHTMITAISQMGAVLGLSTERQREALLAWEQMLSRGSIMSQELRSQWSNSVPGGLAIFSKALGITNSKLLEMVEAGQLLSDEVLPKVAEHILNAFPLTNNANIAARNINRVKNEIFYLKAELGKSFQSPLLKVLEVFSDSIERARILMNLFKEYPKTTMAVGVGLTAMLLPLSAIGAALMAVSAPILSMAVAAIALTAAASALGKWSGGGASLGKYGASGDPRRVAANKASKEAADKAAEAAAEDASYRKTGLSVLDAQNQKESALNTLLNMRLLIIERMNSATKMTLATSQSLTATLSKIEDQIRLQTATDPTDKLKIERQIISSQIEDAKAVPTTVTQEEADAKNKLLEEANKMLKETGGLTPEEANRLKSLQRYPSIGMGYNNSEKAEMKRLTDKRDAETQSKKTIEFNQGQIDTNNASVGKDDAIKVKSKTESVATLERSRQVKSDEIDIANAKEIKKLEQETNDEIEKGLSLAEKRSRLKQKISVLDNAVKDAYYEGTDPVQTAKDKLELAKSRNELSQMDKPAKLPAADSLVSVGNFLGGSKNMMDTVAEKHLAIAQKSLTVQEAMAANIAAWKASPATAPTMTVSAF